LSRLACISASGKLPRRTVVQKLCSGSAGKCSAGCARHCGTASRNIEEVVELILRGTAVEAGTVVVNVRPIVGNIIARRSVDIRSWPAGGSRQVAHRCPIAGEITAAGARERLRRSRHVRHASATERGSGAATTAGTHRAAAGTSTATGTTTTAAPTATATHTAAAP
jgi:hypothetical protein